MSDSEHDLTTVDTWAALRAHTAARIGLGRVGASLPTREVLQFGMAHAQARDAVHLPLDVDALRIALTTEGFASVAVHSAAADRHTYLLRPDLGRSLRDNCRTELAEQANYAELVIVIADGLSAVAVQRHAVPLLKLLRERYATDWSKTTIVIAEQARVAIGDEIAQALGAKAVVVMIGERPGLSSPDSLGLYITYAPQTGGMDSARNCISNVRPAGLPYADAVHKLVFLLSAAMRLQISGVALKDDSALQQVLAEP